MPFRTSDHTDSHLLTDDSPSAYPDPVSALQAAELDVTCRFLGRTYYEGEQICYQSRVWVCAANGWNATGAEC